MSPLRVTPAAIAAAALGLSACGGSSAPAPRALSRPTALYTVSMTGTAESPTGAPHGRGVAIIAFHGPSEVCFRFAHLHGFFDATAAHIDSGAPGRSGPVTIVLSSGPKLHHRGCRTVSAAVSRAIVRRPGAYYVNVHSRRYPRGAVRAQL